jgi:hypothetical protein
MIEASQRMLLTINSQGGAGKDGGGMNTAVKKYYGLQIKTLQNAPRDMDQFEWLLKTKEREKQQEAVHISKTSKKISYRID